MHRPRCHALILLLPLMVPACRRNPPPSPSASGGASPSVVLPRVAPVLPALELPPLSAMPTEQAVAMLVRAHYDPTRLGLGEVAVRVILALPQLKTRVQATATWSTGQAISAKLQSVERNGRTELAPADPGVGKQIWTALQYQVQSLLEGIGTGFLSQRLEHWQKLKGESKLEGEKLILSFKEESGETLVTVGRGWVVEKVENRSPRKIDRWMEYQHRLEQGRNLVTLARMHVSIKDDAALPPGEVRLQKSQDGLTFRIQHRAVGGYLLPAELTKTSSRGEEARLKLSYTAIR